MMNEFNPKERTLARENILKILYQYDITGYMLRDIKKYFIEKRSYDEVYFDNILSLLESNLGSIDKFIEDNILTNKNFNKSEFREMHVTTAFKESKDLSDFISYVEVCQYDQDKNLIFIFVTSDISQGINVTKLNSNPISAAQLLTS